MSTVFVIQGEELIEMFESGYLSEAELQDLLEKYPKLIPGDQINTTEPRRWLLVRREAGVPDQGGAPDRWSVDHLFLDQDAVPTLVEVKRSENTEIRRRIVGQMLDYAANAVAYWPVERIQTDFEERCSSLNVDPDLELAQLIGDSDPDDFWKRVKTNLQAGRIRLLFVADQIPDELRRIVEFLNEQMDPAEVLAVQVRRFKSESVQTLVPQVFGATAHAQGKKDGGGRSRRVWDEESIFDELQKRLPKDGKAMAVARRFIDWAKVRLPRMAFGRGAINGAISGVLDYEGHNHYPVWLFTDGTFQLQFHEMSKHPPFTSEALRRELLTKCNKIPGVKLKGDSIDRYPSIKLEVLAKGDAMDRFMEVMEWYVAQIKGTPTHE